MLVSSTVPLTTVPFLNDGQLSRALHTPENRPSQKATIVF